MRLKEGHFALQPRVYKNHIS